MIDSFNNRLHPQEILGKSTQLIIALSIALFTLFMMLANISTELRIIAGIVSFFAFIYARIANKYHRDWVLAGAVLLSEIEMDTPLSKDELL